MWYEIPLTIYQEPKTVLGIFILEEKCRILFPRSLRHCNEPWTITFLVFQVWSFICQIQVPLETLFFVFFFFTHGWIGECEFANPLGFWVWPCSRAIYLYRICTSCISWSQFSAINCLFCPLSKRNITASSFRLEAGKLVSILFSNELYACKSLTCNWPSRINLKSFKIVYFRL